MTERARQEYAAVMRLWARAGALLEHVWRASDQLAGKLLRPVRPMLLTALQVHHGVAIAPSLGNTYFRGTAVPAVRRTPGVTP